MTREKLRVKEEEWKGTGELQDALLRKDWDIEFLKKQLEGKEADLADFRARASRTEKTQSAKVDKELLKNLFLGYFAAPGNKKNEVAHLLGSVLGFSDEDFEKANGDSGSWFSLRRPGGQSGGVDASITSQFIKFLEAESSPVEGGKSVGVPMSLPDTELGRHSRTSSRSSTPAAGLLRQQFASSTGGSLLGSASMELPSFDGESPLRPPSSSSEFLKEVLQSP